MSKKVTVLNYPKCNFCDKKAHYDGKTKLGPWGYMCNDHFREHGVGLGNGLGQELVLYPLVIMQGTYKFGDASIEVTEDKILIDFNQETEPTKIIVKDNKIIELIESEWNFTTSDCSLSLGNSSYNGTLDIYKGIYWLDGTDKNGDGNETMEIEITEDNRIKIYGGQTELTVKDREIIEFIF